MAITVPTIGSEIDVVSFGKPVVDAINSMQTAVPWITLTPTNGWASEGGVNQPTQYRKIGDMVYLRGSATRASFVGGTFVIMPTGYKPPFDIRAVFAAMVTGAGGVNFIRSDLRADGTIFFNDAVPAISGGATAYLTGIAYSVTA